MLVYLATRLIGYSGCTNVDEYYEYYVTKS
jgi:hypothetical protein